MKTATIEKRIKDRYGRFFKRLGINKKTGDFLSGRWQGKIKFSTYPFVGSAYGKDKRKNVLFIGLDVGRDEHNAKNGAAQDQAEKGILGFEYKRDKVERSDKHNPHIYGLLIGTLYLLRDHYFSSEDEWKNFMKGATYKKLADSFNDSHKAVNLLSYVSLTNFYKYVSIGRESRVGGADRRNIFTNEEWDLLKDEIKIFDPRLIVFQSTEFAKEDSWLKLFVDEVRKENSKRIMYVSAHPSYQGFHQKAVAYLKTFKEIK